MTHLRSAAIALLFLAIPASAIAQDQDQMKKNLDEKLAKTFVKSSPWILDYDEAKAAAKKANKLIFAYFTRSYAN
jgi:hypothetical protein